MGDVTLEHFGFNMLVAFHHCFTFIHLSFGGRSVDALGAALPLAHRVPPHEVKTDINPLNAELNPICYLLALLELTIFSTLAG